jgi:tripartite-type tricarboxylate transporter receptor subunit TctC
MQEVARARPTSHTLILGHIGTLAVNPYIFAKVPYDPMKDFIPVTLVWRRCPACTWCTPTCR